MKAIPETPRRRLALLVLMFLFVGEAIPVAGRAETLTPWPVEKANTWYRSKPWPVGCNFGPSTAINQLEMWQADTFDEATIDRELGWAEHLGFNSVRVFLHNLLWEQDARGFLRRMERFLAVAKKHRINVVFVLLDSVWDPHPKLGRQREPKPHVHNSGWVQSPGSEIIRDPARHHEIQGYIEGVVGHFRKDRRILAWDVFNEPDNPNRTAYGAVELKNKAAAALVLLESAYAWARQARPTQPITSAVWIGNWGDPQKLSTTEKFMLEQSDIITFHNYASLDEMKKILPDRLAVKYEQGMSKHPVGQFRERIGLNIEMAYNKTIGKS